MTQAAQPVQSNMASPEHLRRSLALLRIEPPGWLFERRAVRGSVSPVVEIERWFQQFPNSLAPLVVGLCVLNHDEAFKDSSHAAQLGLKYMRDGTLISSAEDGMTLRRRLDVRHRHIDMISPQASPLLRWAASLYLDAVFMDASTFHYANILQRLVGDRRPRWQHEIFTAVQDTFAPPPNFISPSKTEDWLVAADQLEEQGENRAFAIRAAARADSDQAIFGAIYDALPKSLLQGAR